jgi:branched-chain amino acid transport system substrate-binding protein
MTLPGSPLRCLVAGILSLAILSVPLATRAADPYVIYVIAEVTGSNAFNGAEESKSALAVADLYNKQGGINGRPIKMVIEDSQSSPKVAVQLMNDAVAHNVAVVLGGGVVSTCNAMSGVIKDDGPVLYCWSSGVMPAPGSWVYSSSFSALDQMATGVNYMRERGWTKIATITSTDATGQEADRNVDAVFGRPENKASSLVIREHFGISDIGVTAQLSRIKQSGAQGLIAWTTGTGLGTVLRNLRDAGMDLPVLTTGGNLSYLQMEAYKDSIPSTMLFAAIPCLVPEAVTDPAAKRAVMQFIDYFKPLNVRPDIGYAVAWDGTVLVVQALRKFGDKATARDIRDFINSQTTYVGSLGPMDYKTYPQRGLGKDTILVARWDPLKDRFIGVSKPGGVPIK